MHTQHRPLGAGTIVPLPLDRCRAPSVRHSPLDPARIDRYLTAARMAEPFRDMIPGAVDLAIRVALDKRGAGDVARMLDEQRIAIAAFSAILATLKEADRRLGEAADRVLTAAGLPSEVR